MEAQIFSIILKYIAVLFAISVHEAAHAWTADKLGDPTARMMGRVTLNPIPHFSLFGMVVLPLLLSIAGFMPFGFAKPVMVDLRNVKNPKRDNAIIAAAGPLSNILTGTAFIIVFGILKHTLSNFSTHSPFMQFLLLLILINFVLAVFNLIPIPPLDGSSVLEGVLKGDSLRVYRNFALWTKAYIMYIFIGIILLERFFHINLLSYIFAPVLNIVIGILNWI